MKHLVVLAVFILAVNAASDIEQWAQFKEKFSRNYRNIREEQKRFSIFQENLRTIETHNEKYGKGESSYYMGVTKFADITPAEFKAMLNATKPAQNLSVHTTKLNVAAAPSSIDWRDKGVVSEVKSQGQCGGCWSFSATGALEAAYTIKTGKHVLFSEQNLIDCSTGRDYNNNGCNGGTVHSAFQYAIDFGLETEGDYPFTAKDGTCVYDSSRVAVQPKSYVALPYDSESDLLSAVGTIGPVSASVDADLYQFYSGGIIDDSSCTWTVNHGVLVVGYGKQSNTDYWILKNSWGADWGEEGYLKQARNQDDLCGIALYAVYPVL